MENLRKESSVSQRKQKQPGIYAELKEIPVAATVISHEIVSLVPKNMLWMITLNAFLLPKWVNPFRHIGISPRIEALFNEQLFSLADVVCLQETFSRVEEIKEYASRRGFKQAVFARSPGPCRRMSMRLLGSGLAILSRHDIIESSERELQAGVWTDYFATKSVMHARISTDMGELHVFNTHTQSQINQRHPDRSTEVRLAQLAEVSKFISEMVSTHPRLPVVVCGDMNVDNINNPEEFSKLLQMVIDALPNHKVKEVLEGRGIPTWGGTKRLDYIFVAARKDDAECDVIQAQTEPFGNFSDHYGVSAAVKFSESEFGQELCPVDNQNGVITLSSSVDRPWDFLHKD